VIRCARRLAYLVAPPAAFVASADPYPTAASVEKREARCVLAHGHPDAHLALIPPPPREPWDDDPAPRRGTLRRFR
jgi:hypothetical protein